MTLTETVFPNNLQDLEREHKSPTHPSGMKNNLSSSLTLNLLTKKLDVSFELSFEYRVSNNGSN